MSLHIVAAFLKPSSVVYDLPTKHFGVNPFLSKGQQFIKNVFTTLLLDVHVCASKHSSVHTIVAAL